MKIYYIYHSGFVTETENSYLIFDYYRSKTYKEGMDFSFSQLMDTILTSDKDVYVFVSHGHSDHFSHEIFKWRKNKENIYYILGEDIKIHSEVPNCTTAYENSELSVGKLKINTFGSTDEGVSYLVKADHLNIFHAGDLNWWKWSDDTLEEESAMENAFKHQIKKIHETGNKIDIAFFPVDRRLEENYICGGQFFIEALSPDTFIPMHLWDDYKTTEDFDKYITKSCPNTKTKIVHIHYPNEEITI